MLRPTSRPSTCTIGNVGCIDTVRERHVARLEINRTAMVTLVLQLPQPIGLRAVYDAMTDGARRRKAPNDRAISRKRGLLQPRVLAVEDLHWADDTTLACISRR